MGQDSRASEHAKQQAYRLLRARARTTREVRDHLRQRGLAKRLPPEAGGLSPRDYGRVVRYLMRLGFDADVIRGILAAKVSAATPCDAVEGDPPG